MNYDVAIVGGGLVGSVLACALGEVGLRVALVDASPPPTLPQEGFDVRVSALTPASRQVLERIDVWRGLDHSRIEPFREMHVWDATGSGRIHFDSADIGAPALGYIAENSVLQYALNARLQRFDTVKVYRPVTLEDLTVEPGSVALVVDGARLRARLVVGADGTQSCVRRLAGMGGRVRAHEQRAVVASLDTERGHQHTAWQRFMPGGPLALLPLPGGWVSLVWSMAPGHADGLLASDDDAFAAALGEASEHVLGAITAVAGRASFELMDLNAERYVSERIALVGDAAHTIHPLAGQGVNLGVLDAAALAEGLTRMQVKGRDIGALANLRPYERWRRGHNALMRQTMNGFKWLFQSKAAPVRIARNAGLRLTDHVPPAKRAFMRYASGFAGDLPAMARCTEWGIGDR